jgi:hypothetical protein
MGCTPQAKNRPIRHAPLPSVVIFGGVAPPRLSAN